MRTRILTLTSAVVLAAAAAAAVRVLQRKPREPDRNVGDIGRIDSVPPPIQKPNAPAEVDDPAIKPLAGLIAQADVPVPGGPFWLGVGDSTTLYIEEGECVFDMCSSRQSDAVPTWSIDDGSVAALRELGGAIPSTRLPGSKAAVVIGRGVGRTTVRAFRPRSASDTLPGRTPPSSALRRTVNVTLPVERVKLEQVEPDTLRSEERYLFRAYAFDRTGRRIVGAPVQVIALPGGRLEVADKHGLVLFWPERAGRHTIVASLRGKSDTMVVQVLPSAR